MNRTKKKHRKPLPTITTTYKISTPYPSATQPNQNKNKPC